MANKKFIMHRHNGTGYDTLYPKTIIEQVEGLVNALLSKVNISQPTATTGQVLTVDANKNLVPADLPVITHPVTDVKVDGTSVVTSTVANIPTIYMQANEPSSHATYDVWYEDLDPRKLPLYIEAAAPNVRVQLVREYGRWSGSYSMDGVTWTAWSSGTSHTLANVGDRVYFRGVYSDVPDQWHYMNFTSNGLIKAGGNCQSFWCGDNDNWKTSLTVSIHYAGFYLFRNNTYLITPPALPATTLKQNCYRQMFEGCTSLTTVPNLPATALTLQCYGNMFAGCTSLNVSDVAGPSCKKVWTIPASGTITATGNKAGSGMFTNCAGTRSSDTMAGEVGQSYTYYTQNEPI